VPLKHGSQHLEKNRTRKLKNKSMDKRNVKLNSRKGKKAEAKARAPKVEQTETLKREWMKELKQKQTL